jgi:uncharacterized coiled-coil DUF342 family protein
MLERLPARIDDLTLQIVQLREENRAEHTAFRMDIAELRTEMREVRTEVAELRADVGDVRSEVVELGRHMRVLHEDVIARIAALGEGRSKRRPPRK